MQCKQQNLLQTKTIREIQTIKPEQLTRELSGNIRTVEGEGNERSFRLSFSSEEPYKRYFGNEILDHSDNAVDLSRLNNIGCVLFNHNRDSVIGKIKNAWIENNRGEAEIEFDSDGISENIYQKVKKGTLKGVSVSYMVNRYEIVKEGSKSSDGRFNGPCYVAIDWQPYEISIVSVPADPSVGVGRGFKSDNQPEDLAIYEAQIQINKNLLGGI